MTSLYDWFDMVSRNDSELAMTFFDWFCDESELVERGKVLLPFVRELQEQYQINPHKVRVLFKNNLQADGVLYDSLMFEGIESGKGILWFSPCNGRGERELQVY